MNPVREDILDLNFDLAKNIIHDTLHFAVRIDTEKLPADLLRAYTRAELQVLAAEYPSGRASVSQKRQAQEAARERLQAEAKDGRYLRRKSHPLLWDRPTNTLLVGTTSASSLDYIQRLFKDTFGTGLTLIDAGQQALQRSQSTQQTASVDMARPAQFMRNNGPVEVAWVSDPASHNFLGNEFVLWLWFRLEQEGDTLILSDESAVTAMLARTLMLECPKALSGSETIRSVSPTQLPEARRAIQAGKLPRQAGLTLVRHDQQYELTLQAETMALSGAKLPAADKGEQRVQWEQRVDQLRHLMETLDLLYDIFLQGRLGCDWPQELEQMQHWLQPERHTHLAAAG